MLFNSHLFLSRQVFTGTIFAATAFFGNCYHACALGEPSLQLSASEALQAVSEAKIQQIAKAEITAAIQSSKAKSGAVMVADPRTGKIIAFAEAGARQGFLSWKERFFSPGSAVKPFIAATAIEEKVASSDKIYDCRSPYFVEGTKFLNYAPSFTYLTLTDGIAKSVNICLIKVAEEVGLAKLNATLSNFGFDLTSQTRTSTSEALQLAKLALGEGLSTNLETLVKSYAILANKGHLFPATSGSAISENTSRDVERMLVEVVEHGTGYRASLPGIKVAGKTGTVMVNSEADVSFSQEQSSTLAMFGGYAPADNPRLVIFVVLEDGYLKGTKEKGSGGALAAPVFKNVTAKSLVLLNK